LNLLACRLANQARENTGRPDVAIAGALPPLGGSYRPDNVLPYDEMVTLYREMCGVMAPHVDLFLVETLSTALEAKAVAVAAQAFDLPIVISWTLADGTATLRGGESLAEAFAALEGLPVTAVLTNCSTPESITAAMTAARASNLPLAGGYANGFTGIPGEWDYTQGVQQLDARHDLTPDEYTSHVAAWMANGAKIVGGCCEVGPAHIAALRVHIDGDGA
jgi:S-methylmethionine-dependent homocysteine/selenocysteine methylase